MSKDIPISPERLSFYFYPKHFSFSKAGVFEPGVFSQIRLICLTNAQKCAHLQMGSPIVTR